MQVFKATANASKCRSQAHDFRFFVFRSWKVIFFRARAFPARELVFTGPLEAVRPCHISCMSPSSQVRSQPGVLIIIYVLRPPTLRPADCTYYFENSHVLTVDLHSACGIFYSTQSASTAINSLTGVWSSVCWTFRDVESPAEWQQKFRAAKIIELLKPEP